MLADCLAHAVEQGAERLVDIATLTGAIVTTLGTTYAGLMGQDDEWCEEVSGGRPARGRDRLAAAAARRVRRADQGQVRRHPQRGREPPRRLGHRRGVPAALRRRRAVGASRHRRHRLGHRQGLRAQGRRRLRRAAARPARLRHRGVAADTPAWRSSPARSSPSGTGDRSSSVVFGLPLAAAAVEVDLGVRRWVRGGLPRAAGARRPAVVAAGPLVILGGSRCASTRCASSATRGGGAGVRLHALPAERRSRRRFDEEHVAPTTLGRRGSSSAATTPGRRPRVRLPAPAPAEVDAAERRGATLQRPQRAPSTSFYDGPVPRAAHATRAAVFIGLRRRWAATGVRAARRHARATRARSACCRRATCSPTSTRCGRSRPTTSTSSGLSPEWPHGLRPLARPRADPPYRPRLRRGRGRAGRRGARPREALPVRDRGQARRARADGHPVPGGVRRRRAATRWPTRSRSRSSRAWTPPSRSRCAPTPRSGPSRSTCSAPRSRSRSGCRG